MISRRTVLVAGSGGLAAIGLGAVSQRAAAAVRAAPTATPALFLLDTTLPGADASAAEADRAGIPLAPFAGDIGAVWLDRLAPLWRQRPLPVVGVTYGGAFFCAERLAHDSGLVRAACLAPRPDDVARAAALAIAAVAHPAGVNRPAAPADPYLPAVWALVPRGAR